MIKSLMLYVLFLIDFLYLWFVYLYWLLWILLSLSFSFSKLTRKRVFILSMLPNILTSYPRWIIIRFGFISSYECDLGQSKSRSKRIFKIKDKATICKCTQQNLMWISYCNFLKKKNFKKKKKNRKHYHAFLTKM